MATVKSDLIKPNREECGKTSLKFLVCFAAGFGAGDQRRLNLNLEEPPNFKKNA